ncbi:protein-L-isoaspartate(D-aspartate) O-methyltransferase [Marinilabilia rubra]|uniref:Protein-L-isoaspartate O-methyltransferase n=1 Tax=Marinilabilia rubra TaxID=2162893 RepID=A0A2U2BCU9_9BACT|nr:protein-L-isoaspartate(D-aspartate) O-methyltransferase [Marinilabilia rubra]PWE00894.1 protein-L-isoaspartate O-methyltransferase [Marinilabilia rubra]
MPAFSAGILFQTFIFLLLFALMMMEADAQQYEEERADMVDNQIAQRGIKSRHVLSAMKKVPRHMFVPSNLASMAYSDRPLPIGYDQTISQPFIVAFMSEALDVKEGDKILEIGTGSGYQAAILAEMGLEVWTIEIVPELAEMAKKNLKETGYIEVNVKCGNGFKGWPRQAPFDAIILTAAPKDIPQTLVDQLKTGGTMILPVGPVYSVQKLIKVTKKEKGIKQKTLLPVRFVPMIKSYL